MVCVRELVRGAKRACEGKTKARKGKRKRRGEAAIPGDLERARGNHNKRKGVEAKAHGRREGETSMIV